MGTGCNELMTFVTSLPGIQSQSSASCRDTGQEFPHYAITQQIPYSSPITDHLGLSAEAIDDIVERIEDFLSIKRDEKTPGKPEYPYFVRDHFISPAEHSFFVVLKSIVSDSALISIKVNLGDLFYAKASDPSKYRIYTNKIDRKHVDFLLCDPKTV